MMQCSKLQPGMYYAFQLTSHNACGDSVYPIQWFMTQPSVPNLPSIPTCGEITNNSIELQWQSLAESDWNGSPITEYILQVG